MLIENGRPVCPKLWHNGYDFIVAYTEGECRLLLMKMCGLSFEETEGDGWFSYEDTDLLSWRDEDGHEHCRRVGDMVRENGYGYAGSTE